jgi:alpha-L-rhamnosidase
MNHQQTLISFLCLFFSYVASAEMKVDGLTCELLNNPVGIETLQPRLGWKIESDQRNVVQTAFQVLVASSPEKLTEEAANLWNSGKIETSQSQLVPYHGGKLESTYNCYWKVKVWTNKGETAWSKPAQWTMGLLYYKDWRARWIGFDRTFPWDDDSFHSRLSARYFRKEFELKKAVKEAKAYIIGLGLYELSLNGEKIGAFVLAPSPTDYDQNIKYNIYDLTNKLKTGTNAVGVVVGNGRFYASRQHYKGYKIKNFGFPKLLFQLIVKYTDGTTEYIRSDNSWKGTANGPVRSNNEYDGEEYDARKEMKGWNTVGFDDRNWLVPAYVEQPDGKYEAQLNPNMSVVREIKPVSVREQRSGKYILDLGQNFAGWLQLKVNGNAGDTITMRFGEVIQDDGELFTANLRDAQATAKYILKGEGPEIWEPRFVYFGFRYVEITGWPGKPTVDNFVGKVVSDDMAVHGSFETSNQLINQIYSNASWGILSNYKGMPVDCPQRNERQPWLGDRTVGCYGENFIFDNSALYKKWVDDIAYSQKWDGTISDVAPAYWRYYSDNMSWCGTFLMVADMLYRHTGDAEPILKHYAAMKKWLNYMENHYLKDGIMTKDSYGDWCEPPATIEEGRDKSADRKNPSALISTAYYYHYLGLMQEFARLSGRESDIAVYKNQATVVKEAFQKIFYKAEVNGYGQNKLTENILAVAMDLVPSEKKDKVIQTIVKTIKETNNTHLSTGVIGTQWIMRTLTENGHAGLAWKLATNTTYPGWGYMVENGATTIWELWNGNMASPKMNSYNHVMMLGDLLIWFYENLAGIKPDRKAVGFKQIIMKPEMIDGLDFVNSSCESPYGLIASCWTKKKSKFEWNISVPVNTTAIAYIPAETIHDVLESGKKLAAAAVKVVGLENGRAVLQLGSGNYYFSSRLKK